MPPQWKLVVRDQLGKGKKLGELKDAMQKGWLRGEEVFKDGKAKGDGGKAGREG